MRIAFEKDQHTGDVVAWIPDLPGCMTQGGSFEEAAELIQDAEKLWLEVDAMPLSSLKMERKV